MNPTRAICAGFREDLLAVLREAGEREPLADLLPFVEPCGSEFEGLLVAALDAAAVRFEQRIPQQVFGERIVVTPTIDARPLLESGIRLLAKHDDLALGALYRAVVTRRGLADVSAPLAALLRALVVQCRAAVANGWDVLLLDTVRPGAGERGP